MEVDYQPRWFKLQGEEFVYSGNYWEEKANGYFTNVPDIYQAT